MSEPQVQEGPQSGDFDQGRKLSAKEIRDTNRVFRTRLIDALRNHRDAMDIITGRVGQIAAETVSHTDNDGNKWLHGFSRGPTSLDQLVVRSQLTSSPESRFIEESLEIDDSKNPTIAVRKFSREHNFQAKFDDSELAVKEADKIVKRIENQIGT